MHTLLMSLWCLWPAAVPRAADPIAECCARFAGHDGDGDGTAEIESLQPMFAPASERPAPARLVLVLVEQRIAQASDLDARLQQLERDLERERWFPRTIAAQLYAGPRHQDGRTLLALRAFLHDVRAIDPTLAGVLLVGAFPEAFLVRTCNWRRRDTLVLHAGTPQRKQLADTDNLRSVPEPVADTCDLVLGDLDGRWDECYVEPSERVPALIAAFPGGVPAHGGITRDYERSGVVYQDFFHVNDGRLEVRELLDASGEVAALDVVPLDDLANRELSADDLRAQNSIARPEIAVSRINARGVALRLKAKFHDAQGKPQSVAYPVGQTLPSWASEPWESDPDLEQRLLVEFLDRDHRYRTGELRPEFRPASLACGLGSGMNVLRAASLGWTDADARLDAHGDVDLVQVVEWLKSPAILRTVRAHSDAWGSAFGATDVARLEQCAGGVPWSFTPEGNALVPSLKAACSGGQLGFFLLRTLWANHVLPDSASFYLHTGCQAISPGGAASLPYSDPRYALRQGAASLLFYGQGLALVGRAKVFYDEPREFCEMLAQGKTFGAAWQRYFEVESQAASFAAVGGDIGRKRAYFWSLLGDWTLMLLPGAGH
ncbi:MAG: hypothetical protein U1E76_02730 [Planctomycetota bacterium]